jgi:uncharacterized protein (DUF983 family)
MRPTIRTLISRALRLRCPRCGEGPIFRRVVTYTEHPACPHCGFAYDPRGESLVFMYFSTAFLTGLLVVVMLLTNPEDLGWARARLVAGALALYFVSMPFRKALAIALNFVNAGWQ